MTLFDWLSSPSGQALTNAVVLLVLAITAFISYRTHGGVDRIEKHVKGPEVED